MRTKNSIYNIIGNITTILVQVLLTFFVRIVFVKMLNEEFLGIQGLFTNIISMLTVAELGISTAISFSLYKPLSDNDVEKISKIMTLLRKIYFLIGVIVITISLCLMPFLHYFVTDYHFGKLNIIFTIYFMGLAIEYFIAYPEILISADQKRYKITMFYTISTLLLAIFQIMILYLTKSFIAYLLIDFIIRIFRFILINLYVKKLYKKINFYSKEKISNEDKKQIITNVKSLFLYKLGDYCINGTDNIIVSKFINIVTVGIYNNYLSIIIMFKNLMVNIINGISSSFGNLLVKDSKEVQKRTFLIMNFITFLISSFIFLELYFLFDDFITICFGSKYLISNVEKILICINFYIINLLLPVECVKNAAGLYYKDRYCSIIQAFINFVLSIILCLRYGLIGVILGTTFSYILLPVWERPFMVFKYIFDSNVLEYYKNYIKYLFILFISCILFYYIFIFISVSNIYISFVLKGFLIGIIYSGIIILLFYKTSEFKYIIGMVKNIFRRKNDKISTN